MAEQRIGGMTSRSPNIRSRNNEISDQHHNPMQFLLNPKFHPYSYRTKEFSWHHNEVISVDPLSDPRPDE